MAEDRGHQLCDKPMTRLPPLLIFVMLLITGCSLVPQAAVLKAEGRGHTKLCQVMENGYKPCYPLTAKDE
jgi:hypothetical protein